MFKISNGRLMESDEVKKAITILHLLEMWASKRITVSSRHSDAYDEMIYKSREILENWNNAEHWSDW